MDTKFWDSLASRSSGEPPRPPAWPLAEFQIHVLGPAHGDVPKVSFPVSCQGLPTRAAARAGGSGACRGWPRDLQCGIWSVQKQDFLWAFEWVSSLVTELSPEWEEARSL